MKNVVYHLKHYIKNNKRLYHTFLDIYWWFVSSPTQRAGRRFMEDGGEQIRYRYKIYPDDIIFDVGGYRGEWAEAFLKYGCFIYVFEPSSSSYERLKDRFRIYDNVFVYNFGLDRNTHYADFSLEDDGSSQYHMKDKIEKVKFVDILEFMKKENIQNVKLMKMNIEGGEYDILEYLIEKGAITMFQNIQIQFHDVPEINGKKRMYRIWKELHKTHTLEWAYRPFIHESWKKRGE